jgi:spore coat polysaccharide biosynthesis predicted glycosyltransferase SpsG
MASLTLPVSEEFKSQLKKFLWVNWSEIAREEVLKKLIFDSYVKTGEISNEEWEFCEKIDWHPVDELHLKDDFVKKIRARKKEKSIKFDSVSDLFKSVE